MPPAKPASTSAWPGTRDFRVTARTYEDAARSQCSFYLQPVDGQALPEFRPGQFLTFVLQMPTARRPGERRSVTRCYSLSDAPAPDHYRVSIKRVPPPAIAPSCAPGVSSNHFHDHVQVGDVLQVKAPSGHFYIDPDPAVPAVLVAGGIGITPMMSMLRWCLAEQPERVVHLYYGLRQGQNMRSRPQLEAAGRVAPALQAERRLQPPCRRRRAGSGLPAHRSRGPRAAAADPAAWAAPVLHLRPGGHDGKPGAGARRVGCARRRCALRGLRSGVRAQGRSRHRRSATRRPRSRSRCSSSARGAPSPGTARDANLLDFAERHGVAVDSGCRSGSCGSCETRQLAGSVNYAQRPDHDPAPGHCLLCVGPARSRPWCWRPDALQARLLRNEVLPFVAVHGGADRVHPADRRGPAPAEHRVDRPLARHTRRCC